MNVVVESVEQGELIIESAKKVSCNIIKVRKEKVIYRIQNKLNGKVYIGQTINGLSSRMSSHLCNGRKKGGGIDSALVKYGIDNFEISILTTAEDIEELNRLEILHIEKENCIAPNGYNLHTGGNNYKCSEITKERLRKSAIGRKMSEETKKKMSEKGKVRIFTEEHKLNIRKAVAGKEKAHTKNLPQNQKGYYSGENHPRAKLTNAQVIEIRALLVAGCVYKNIADMFGTTNKHIALIKGGWAYKNVK